MWLQLSTDGLSKKDLLVDEPVPAGYLPLRYNEPEVRLRLHAPWLYRVNVNTGKLISSILKRHKQSLKLKDLPKYELVAWPLYVVRFFLQGGTNKTQEIFIAVDAWSKVIARFERMMEVKETISTNFQLILEPTLPLDEVKSIAKYGLMQQLLRQRGLHPTPETVIPEVVRLVYSPIWVCYFARTLHSLDIRLLDGYSGEKIGPQTRSAFLNALIYKQSMQVRDKDIGNVF